MPPDSTHEQFPQVIPVTGSRLEQLQAMLPAARAARDEAADRLKAIEAGIKAEAAAACPGHLAVSIAGGPGRPALQLRWHKGKWYVPAAALREKHPEVWDELRMQERGSWQLHELKAGDGS